MRKASIQALTRIVANLYLEGMTCGEAILASDANVGGGVTFLGDPLARVTVVSNSIGGPATSCRTRPLGSNVCGPRTSIFCNGDLDGDHFVGTSDFEWLQDRMGCFCPELDLNEDGVLDALDIGELSLRRDTLVDLMDIDDDGAVTCADYSLAWGIDCALNPEFEAGCWGLCSPATLPLVIQRYRQDLDFDLDVDLDDVQIFLNEWGGPYDEALDFDCNGVVDTADLQRMNWI